MAARKPASVLPEPVGAQTSVCRPATIAGQPSRWASVGPSGNRRANQVRTAGWKRSRAGSAGAKGSGAIATGQTLAVKVVIKTERHRPVAVALVGGRGWRLPAEDAGLRLSELLVREDALLVELAQLGE